MTESPKTPLTIMLVDDDTFLLDMYAKKFREEGFEVILSAKSDDALAKLRQNVYPDIILLDIIMPEITGLEILQAMREERLAEDAAVIMLTNQGEQESIDVAKTYGADGYIVKATSIPSEVMEEVKLIYEKSRE